MIFLSLLSGPATVRMISENGPAFPLPLHLPPGHMVQQVLDENGVLTHVIMSQTGPPPPPPPPPHHHVVRFVILINFFDHHKSIEDFFCFVTDDKKRFIDSHI